MSAAAGNGEGASSWRLPFRSAIERHDLRRPSFIRNLGPGASRSRPTANYQPQTNAVQTWNFELACGDGGALDWFEHADLVEPIQEVDARRLQAIHQILERLSTERGCLL